MGAAALWLRRKGLSVEVAESEEKQRGGRFWWEWARVKTWSGQVKGVRSTVFWTVSIVSGLFIRRRRR